MIRLLVILFFLSPVIGLSQIDTVAHLYTFGGLNNDNAESIESTTDGGYIVVGATSSNSSGNTDIYLLKVDSLCNYEWSFALGGTNNDWGYSVKQTFDKGYIVAASSNSFGNGGYNAVLYKRDSLGSHQWTKRYGGQDWDFAYDVVQTYDSGFVFCGETYNNTNGFSDVYVVKTNNLGDTLWTKVVGGSLVDKGNSIIETSDSNIVIAGVRTTITDSTDIYLLKFTDNGVLIWDSIYNHPLYDVANSVIESVNGDYVLGGVNTSMSASNDKDFYLMRTDEDGVLIWENNYTVLGDDEIFDLKEDANGKLINVGHIEGFGAGMKDAFLFYINSNGSWGGLGPSYGGVLNDGIKSVAMNAKGGFCLAGFTESFGVGNDDVLLIRLDTVVLDPDTTINIFEDGIPLTVAEVSKSNEIIIFPNPSADYFSIKPFNQNVDRIEMYDVYGRKVKELRGVSNSRVNISNLRNGIYTILLFLEGELIATKKHIKN